MTPRQGLPSRDLPDRADQHDAVDHRDVVRRHAGRRVVEALTGAEIEACTLWEGIIYTADSSGNIELVPAEGVDAPQTLIFPDLGPALRMSAAYGAKGFSKVPWDVFALKGCQE